MKKRDLIIVLVVLAFGVIYNFIESGEIRFMNGCSTNQMNLIDMKHPNAFPRAELHYAASEIQEIVINNIAGGIEVVKSEDGAIRIQPEVRVYHRNRGPATDIQKDIIITPTQTTVEHGKLSVDVTCTKEFDYNRVRVHFIVSIPDTVSVNLWNRYGDVVVNGAGKSITIDNKYGDVGVKHVSADLDIQHKHGRLVVRNIQGALNLNSAYSRISVTNAASLKLTCAHAQVFLANIENETIVEEASYSDIRLDTGNGFVFDGRQTKINLDHIKNGVKITNSHNSISLDDIAGNINIQTRHCRIRLNKIVADEVIVYNEYNKVDINAIVAKKMDLQISHGDLDIDFLDITELLNIQNSYSRVKMFYPKALNPSINIDLSYGEFKNNTTTPLSTLSENNNIKVNHVAGPPQITIVTSYNDVQLYNNNEGPTHKKGDIKFLPPAPQPAPKVETEEFKKIDETNPQN